jgi:hypothetical protein
MDLVEGWAAKGCQRCQAKFGKDSLLKPVTDAPNTENANQSERSGGFILAKGVICLLLLLATTHTLYLLVRTSGWDNPFIVLPVIISSFGLVLAILAGGGGILFFASAIGMLAYVPLLMLGFLLFVLPGAR